MNVCTTELAKFSLGQVISTPTAVAALKAQGLAPESLLARHQRGDWGHVSPEQRELNDQAVTSGSCTIESIYQIGTRWIAVITKGDRSLTTLLLDPHRHAAPAKPS